MSAPGGYHALRIERHDAVLSVVLVRPEKHDAFDEVVITELTRAFGEAARDAFARVVVLRSTGRSFSAGGDLEWMRRMAEASEADNVADAERMEDMFRAVATCPKPVVARVQGAALGGGAGLVAASDVVVAAESAVFGFTEVRLGLLPAVIAPYVLRKIPAGRAQPLFLTGERFSAARARELGLVDRVTADDDLDAALDGVVAELLAGGPAAQAASKRLVAEIEGRSLDDARGLTTRAIASARASSEGREGIDAFLAKRKPSWSD